MKSTIPVPLSLQADIFTVKQQGRVVKRRDLLHPVMDLDVVVQNGNDVAGAATVLAAKETSLVLLDMGGKPSPLP